MWLFLVTYGGSISLLTDEISSLTLWSRLPLTFEHGCRAQARLLSYLWLDEHW